MPMPAHFEQQSSSERRGTARRALRLGIGGRGERVCVHDLSLTGALLETSVAMLVGATIEIALPHAGQVEATIVWNSGEFYGCQFNQPISPAALSAALLQSMPRPLQAEAADSDPVAELRELSAEVERLALRMDDALTRLGRK